LVRQDGKRPNGLTLIPFEGGRSLTWDVTVVCTTADSYIDLAKQGPGCVAEMAASRKEAKYAALWTLYDFQGGQRAAVFLSTHFSRHPPL